MENQDSENDALEYIPNKISMPGGIETHENKTW